MRDTCHAARRRICFAAALAALTATAAGALRADTIFLKDGTQILDCKITKETDDRISVRTPVGEMVIPLTEIHRIQRIKTVHDRYAEELAKIREGDVNGLFKLALWCRSIDGLRKESDELLAKVIALEEDHVKARSLLGHLRFDSEWHVPEPLSIRLEVNGANERTLRQTLGLFLESRGDVRLAEVSKSESRGEDETEDPLDVCTVSASVVVSRQAALKFYGKSFGQPGLAASIVFAAESPWLGRTKLKTTAVGQVPGAGANTDIALQNAVMESSVNLHKFLDQLIERRTRALVQELRKRAREARSSANP